MAIELTLSNGGGQLEFVKGLPTEYNGPVLRGAIAVFAKTNVGQISIQELTGEGYSIRLGVAKFFQNIVATGSINLQGMYSYFMLKNGMRKEFKTIGKIHLRQDQYSCFFTEATPCKAKFEKNTEYRTLDIFYSPQLVEELIPYFPELKQILIESTSSVLPGKKCWMLPSMSEITVQILNCPYDEATCRFYFDLKVRELLYQMMENTFKRKATDHNFTPWEISRIHEAKKILASYISKKPPSFRFLSRQVALNSLKLKTGFRQHFNMGMFEWLAEQKMQHARDLVLTTNKPIKAIGLSVGYSRSTNFITAFRKRFGKTPRSLRG
ncbi:MAG: helix-turn-helix domain-containing protein [Bacteroidetes bacterium]|nr:MAG: helix-turn-helix domain-containing protein [Bacteroidota bacterium]